MDLDLNELIRESVDAGDIDPEMAPRSVHCRSIDGVVAKYLFDCVPPAAAARGPRPICTRSDMGKRKVNERWVAVIPQAEGVFRFACMAVTSRFDILRSPRVLDAGRPTSRHIWWFRGSPQRRPIHVIVAEQRTLPPSRAAGEPPTDVQDAAAQWIWDLRASGQLRLGDLKVAGDFIDLPPLIPPPQPLVKYHDANATRPRRPRHLSVVDDAGTETRHHPYSVAAAVAAMPRLAKRLNRVPVRLALLCRERFSLPVMELATPEEAKAMGCIAAAWFANYRSLPGDDVVDAYLYYQLASGEVAVIESRVAPAAAGSYWQSWFPAGVVRDRALGGRDVILGMTMDDLINRAASFGSHHLMNTVYPEGIDDWQELSRYAEQVRTNLVKLAAPIRDQLTSTLDEAALACSADLSKYNYYFAKGSPDAREARIHATAALPLLEDSLAWTQAGREAVDRHEAPARAVASAWKLPVWTVERAIELSSSRCAYRAYAGLGEMGIAVRLNWLGETPGFDQRTIETAFFVIQGVMRGAGARWTKADHVAAVERILFEAMGRTIREEGWEATATLLETFEPDLNGADTAAMTGFLAGLVETFEILGRSISFKVDIDLRTYNFRALARMLGTVSFRSLVECAKRWEQAVPDLDHSQRPDRPRRNERRAPAVQGAFSLLTSRATVTPLDTDEEIDRERRDTGYCPAYAESGVEPQNTRVSIVSSTARCTAEFHGREMARWHHLNAWGARNSPIAPGSTEEALVDELVALVTDMGEVPVPRSRKVERDRWYVRMSYVRYADFEPTDRISSAFLRYGDCLWRVIAQALPRPVPENPRTSLRRIWIEANPRAIATLQGRIKMHLEVFGGSALRDERMSRALWKALSTVD